MNTTPTFEKTVDVLVKAYLNDTLEHANCSACAVGNLIAEARGVKPVPGNMVKPGEPWRFSDGTHAAWMSVFVSNLPGSQRVNPDNYIGEAKAQIDSTGYSWHELARIEEAFEEASDRCNMASQSQAYRDKQMFKGLMNVVDVLADIHGIDLEKKEAAKLLFVKA